VASAFSFLGSILMFYIGSMKAISSFDIYFGAQRLPQELGHLTPGDLAMVTIVESLDAFLFGLVLLVFAYGVYNLFFRRDGGNDEAGNTPSWLRINSIRQLKNILAEIIIVVLFVLFLRTILVHIDQLKWEVLVLPVSIGLLGLSLKLLQMHR
jgi:uncharacterized membrane protein YqhA